MLHRSSVIIPGTTTEREKEAYVKDIEFKMRTRIVAKICPNEVIALSEKRPGREDGETTKLSDGTFFLNFRNEVSIKYHGHQQYNAEV